MSELALSKRMPPVINKRAFIYMFKKVVSTSGTVTYEEIQVGQFEDWGFSNNVNTMQYQECGYLTALNIPLDYSFGGYLSKGLLNSKLFAMSFNPGTINSAKNVANGDVFKSGTKTPYGALPKCKIKLVMQYSDTPDDSGVAGTEAVYEYDGCVLFNHRVHNARGIVTESLSFVAESLDMYQQNSQAGRNEPV